MNVGGIYFEEGLDDGRIAMTVDRTIEAEGMTELVQRIQEIQASGRKARILLDLRSFSFEAGVVGEKLRSPSTLWSGIDRLAYVVDSSILRSVIGAVEPVTPMHLRAFCSGQVDTARDWVFSD